MRLLTDQKNLYWTEHSRIKMRQYRLSESRVKRVLRFPKRIEEGIAPDTVAGMQPAGSKKHPYEIWVMYQRKVKSKNDASRRPDPANAGEGSRSITAVHGIALPRRSGTRNDKFTNKQITIISTWRYPGVSPVHEPPPIPDDVWEIIRKEKKALSNK